MAFIFSFIFFTLASILLLFSISAFIILRLKPWCSCDVCQSFLTSTWSQDYNNLCDWYTHLLQKSPTATIHVHVLGNIITANPENVEYMLKTNFHNYPKGKPFSAILGDLLGRGIFNADGDLWKFQRKMASLELGSVSVRSLGFDIVTSEIQSRLIPLLSSVAGKEELQVDGNHLDLQDIFRRFSFDTICKFSFGLDPGCLKLSLPMSEFASAFDLASKLSAERAISASPAIWKMKKLLNLGSEKKLKEAIRTVHDLADEVINYKRSNFSETESRGGDLLSRFMGTIEDDEFLRDIVVSFLLAGRDTVSSSLTTFFFLLSQSPAAVKSIRDESDRLMGSDREKIPTFDHLRGMHYLHAAVHESMRLFPPVQFDSKFCQTNDVLPDSTFVSKGTRVTFHPYAMGRMERIWGSDCLEFKPERWLNDGVFRMEDPYKYPVFQAGPRVCLGKEMAVVEMKAVALSLIRRFDIEACLSGRVLKFVPGLTATVRGGLPVIVRQRQYSS